MRFEEHEYISKESCGECITISKKALEEWRDHYKKVSDKFKEDGEWKFGFYLGKADVLTEILKHFDKEEQI